MRTILILTVVLFNVLLRVNCYKLYNQDVLPFKLDINDRYNFYRDFSKLLNNGDVASDEYYDNGNVDDTSVYGFDRDESNDADDSDDDEFMLQKDSQDQESELYSSLVGGYQFVSGGAGEGKQNLKPDGNIPNKGEVKSDIYLPAYCTPPNPCPVGYKGDDCDRRPYEEFTAEYSKEFQSRQNCMCDNDHNECRKQQPNKDSQVKMLLDNLKINNNFSSVVAKKSPRVRRSLKMKEAKDQLDSKLPFHVAKKSPQI